MRKAHVPVFTSPSRAAKSLASLFRYHSQRRAFLDEGSAPVIRSATNDAGIAAAASLPEGPTTLSEHAAKQMLQQWGIPSARETQVRTVEEAVEAATAIGYPVALKLDSVHIPHKTEAGVVALNIRNRVRVKGFLQGNRSQRAKVCAPVSGRAAAGAGDG